MLYTEDNNCVLYAENHNCVLYNEDHNCVLYVEDYNCLDFSISDRNFGYLPRFASLSENSSGNNNRGTS